MVIRIVPPSFVRIPSPEATAVVPLDVPPSIRLISAGVAVIAVAEAAARTGKVPETLGKEIVLSPVASIDVNVVSWSSAVAPSNTTALLAFIVTEFVIVCVPETTRFVADSVPVLGLYVKLPSDSSPTLPPSASAPATNVRTLFSFVDSLSVTVTVVATADVPE